MGLVSRNNIQQGDQVIWSGGSLAVPRQNGLANKLLKKNYVYTVEFVFPGDEITPEQLELDGLNELFVCDMFMKLQTG